MAARRQRFLMFLFIFIFSVHSLFYFGVGLISDTVFVSEIWELNSMIHSRLSILWLSAFFMVQLSHLHMTPGNVCLALTIQTFVGKVMPLLFNMLSRFVIAFLPRSKRLLISWLQLPSAVILEPNKIK